MMCQTKCHKNSHVNPKTTGDKNNQNKIMCWLREISFNSDLSEEAAIGSKSARQLLYSLHWWKKKMENIKLYDNWKGSFMPN